MIVHILFKEYNKFTAVDTVDISIDKRLEQIRNRTKIPFHSNARSRSLKFTAVDTVDMSMDKRLNQIPNRIEKIPLYSNDHSMRIRN